MVSVDDRIGQLKAEYAAQLPAKLQAVAGLWARTQGEGSWNESGRELYRKIHSLAGSAPTFGYRRLGGLAHHLELMIADLIERNIPLAPKDVGEIEGLLVGMQEAVRRPGDDGLESLVAPATPEPDRERVRLVLCADADPVASQRVRQVIHFGYEVHCHPDLQALVHEAEGVRPDVLVLDMELFVDAGGAAMLAALQQRWSVRVPVVFISARGDLDSRLAAAHIGADAYLVKPIDIAYLTDKLDKLISASPPEPYRVLIIDASIVHAEHYARTLDSAGISAEAVSDPHQALEALENFDPEVILMDIALSSCTAMELAKVIRQQDNYLGVPIVYFSSRADVERQLSAVNLQGDDFLTRPITPDDLVLAVVNRAQRYRALRSFMIRDSLTGLLNHTKLTESLEQEVERARRHGGQLAFAMIDLDHFKSINDTYGHQAGDRVIKSFARILTQRLRRIDIMGRYGGEEFSVIFLNTPVDAAAKVVEDIRRDFAELRHSSPHGEFSVTFSCGIAGYPALAGATALIEASDRALYQAKRSGRSRICTAEP